MDLYSRLRVKAAQLNIKVRKQDLQLDKLHFSGINYGGGNSAGDCNKNSGRIPCLCLVEEDLLLLRGVRL